MKTPNNIPEIINGGIFSDNRGDIAYVNGFNFEGVKRFYIIEHPDSSVIRAWQYHRIEKKWFYVVQGSFCIAWVKVDNWENPSPNLAVEFKILNASESEIISIPAGYANGLKALEPNSKIIVFSDMDVETSIKEKIRFDKNMWFNWENIK